MKLYARELRKEQTDAERALWLRIKNRQLLGFKFRRQVILDGYIADFVYLEKRLIIELDGGHHLEQRKYDNQRTKYLNENNFKVIRFWNNDVLKNMEIVVEEIANNLLEDCVNTPHPNPLPQGERG
ncbi:MAG: endonuclease domain-containing protein [Gammaproteobacteria bacterium]|jgi:very-short-patch-repair endonuclease|nr:endonuclease domain-containing protein [Gammaproteobacteria bacterium]